MVRKIDESADACPPELDIIDAISGKWTVLVVHILSDKTMRHGALRRAVGGISQKVLTQTLRALESNGIVARKVYPVVPPQVEYSLTSLGRTLVPVLDAVCEWTRQHCAEMEKLRKRQDAARRESGAGRKDRGGGPQAPAASGTI